MENKKLNIAVIYGSVRPHRVGIRSALFIFNKIKERGHNVTLIDPIEFKLPLLEKMYKEYKPKNAPEILEKLHKILIKADAYIIVSAEYNHNPPPALTNLIDHFMEEYFFKPSGIVSYSVGSFGGVRAAMKLRTLLPEVGMSSIPSTFPVSNVANSFDESGKDITENKDYEKRVKKFLDEFEWYAFALKNHRDIGKPY